MILNCKNDFYIINVQSVREVLKKISRRLIDLGEIKPGSRVLDIATGIGEPAITAANKVGSGGHVLPTDISPLMLSVAKQRAISLGLQNIIEFKEGDIETIDLPSSAFDAVLCRWGLMFLPDLKAGLSNIHQSLVEGGHLAAACLGFASSRYLDCHDNEYHNERN